MTSRTTHTVSSWLCHDDTVSLGPWSHSLNQLIRMIIQRLVAVLKQRMVTVMKQRLVTVVKQRLVTVLRQRLVIVLKQKTCRQSCATHMSPDLCQTHVAGPMQNTCFGMKLIVEEMRTWGFDGSIQLSIFYRSRWSPAHFKQPKVCLWGKTS